MLETILATCEISLSGFSKVDLGEWTCLMESYVFGPMRGETERKIINIEVVADKSVEDNNWDGKIRFVYEATD